ncbi:MAG: DUF2628 domain-containing protein [Marinoscillum sp.]
MLHTEEHYRLYFGKKATYYLGVVKDYDTGKSLVFNLFAFLFGLFWMLYRKMYSSIFVVVVLLFLEVIVEQIIFNLINASLSTETVINRISLFIWAFIIGSFSNRLYVRQADKKINKILDQNLSEEETNRKIKKAGGVTFIPHLFLVLVLITLIFLGKQGFFVGY